MDADVPARQGKGVNRGIIHDEKFKTKISILGVRGEFLPNVLDVFLNLRIGDYLVSIAKTFIDRTPDLRLEVLAQNSVRRAADIG